MANIYAPIPREGGPLADFPPEALVVHGVVPRHPDDFLCELHASNPETVEAGVDTARQNLRITAPR